MLLKELKNIIFKRANGLCEYCKSPADISSQAFVMEHIVPKSKGGETISGNLALACQGCNNYKYNKLKVKDKISSKIVSLFNPRKQKWKEHFVWSEDTTELIGTTAKGRVTVDELKLNRPELKNLRKLLSEVGKHPPA